MKKNSNECKKSPKLTVPEIIDYCKNILGITFNLMDEEKAKTFLEKKQFFLPLKTVLFSLHWADNERQVYWS